MHASSAVFRYLWSFASSPAEATTPAQEEEEEMCKAWVVLHILINQNKKDD